MKSITVKFLTAVILITLLTACAREEFKDLYGFTQGFDYESLTPEDFLTEKDESGFEAYYAFFDEENPRVMLKLICTSENKIDEVRIYLPKYDENAHKKPVTTEDSVLFMSITSACIKAFTGYGEEEVRDIVNEMQLYEKKAYENEGEMTKAKNNFLFVYHSASTGSEFIIYNTHLKAVPETEKPESRPMYGDTTKIRTETVPTK